MNTTSKNEQSFKTKTTLIKTRHKRKKNKKNLSDATYKKKKMRLKSHKA